MFATLPLIVIINMKGTEYLEDKCKYDWLVGLQPSTG